MELTSREIATLIVLIAFVGLVFVLAPDRRGLIGLMKKAVVAFGAWKVWAPVAVYLVYSSGIVAVMAHWGLWSPSQLKDTVVAVLFTGLPVLFNATKFKDGSAVFRRVLKEVAGISALLVAYLGLAPFPLWGELILQSILGVLIAMSAAAAVRAETAITSKVLNVVIALVALAVLIHVTTQVLLQAGAFDWAAEVTAFAISVWLPLAQIPFIYAFSVLAVCETALVRLRLNNKLVAPPFRVRVALVLGFHGSLRYGSRFSGLWIPRVAAERTFTGTRRIMHGFRAAVRGRSRQRKERRARLRESAGVTGVDVDGLWIDRREFVETKRALDDLYFMQMGVRRNGRGRYLSDADLLLNSWSLKGLSDKHCIAIHVDDVSDRWFASRRTVGGYYFGVGGQRDLDERWQYDGSIPPVGFPPGRGAGWQDISSGERSAEWEKDDGDVPEN